MGREGRLVALLTPHKDERAAGSQFHPTPAARMQTAPPVRLDEHAKEPTLVSVPHPPDVAAALARVSAVVQRALERAEHGAAAQEGEQGAAS